jgi:2-dehydropantoate 2-reductase
MNTDRTIGVAGAGSIGCFVGGMLAAGGRRVALLARPRVIHEIERNGLRLTSFEGFDRTIAASQLTLSEDPGVFADASVVLVTEIEMRAVHGLRLEQQVIERLHEQCFDFS